MSLLNNIINSLINFWLIFKFNNEGNQASKIVFFVLFILACIGLINDIITFKKGLKRSEKWMKRGRRPTWFDRINNEFEENDRFAYMKTGKWFKWIAICRYMKIKIEFK